MLTMVSENDCFARYLGACEMHILKMVYFSVTTLLNTYFMNKQMSYGLFYYGASSKIIFNLNYLKDLLKSLSEQTHFCIFIQDCTNWKRRRKY